MPVPDGTPDGTYVGKVTHVLVGNPGGDYEGAWIDFVAGNDKFTAAVYLDNTKHPELGTPSDQIEWMRRGAMLGVAQRAFTNEDKVRVRIVMKSELFIQSIQIFKDRSYTQWSEKSLERLASKLDDIDSKLDHT